MINKIITSKLSVTIESRLRAKGAGTVCIGKYLFIYHFFFVFSLQLLAHHLKRILTMLARCI